MATKLAPHVSQPTWLTPNRGVLALIKEGEYFEYQLDAYDRNGAGLKYSVVSGKLPPGMRLQTDGLLAGVPVITTATQIDSYQFEFTARAQNRFNKVADRTFRLTVNAIVPPTIIPTISHIGDFFVGSKINVQLHVLDPNPNGKPIWSITNGQLPPGVELDPETGKISGYLLPRDSSNDQTYTVENKRGNYDHLLYSNSPYAPPISGFDPLQTESVYTFDVEVFDGNATDKQRYYINVYSKSVLTVDNTGIMINGLNALGQVYTSDMTNKAVPILLTTPDELPQTRQNSNFAFKFNGIDLDGDEIEYKLFTSSQVSFDQGATLASPYNNQIGFDGSGFDQIDEGLPPNLVLDPNTGWYTGRIDSQAEDIKIYKFSVYCFKKINPLEFSKPIQFTLKVLGDFTNVINWETPSDLGTIFNGDISQLQVKASTPSGKQLYYMLQPGEYTNGFYSKLPQGLQLLPVDQSTYAALEDQYALDEEMRTSKFSSTGYIVGRTSFRFFSLDKNKTTIDGNKSTFDDTYTFTIKARDAENTISSSKTFTVRLTNRYIRPYENLYLRAYMPRDRRFDFYNLIEDQSIFPNELLYRKEDPYFGKIKDFRFLFLPGLNPATASKYVDSTKNNHFRKRLEIGDVKTAVALDENFNVKYEVVYVEVHDSSNYGNKIPSKEFVDLSGKIKNPYYDEYMNIYKTFYPNDFYHMKKEVVENIGYTNQGALPEWMTCVQPDGRVLGFVRAVVLAYTVPGAAKLMAFRLKVNNVSFGDINFTIDRYQLDNQLSANYDIANDKFEPSSETTFDRLSPSGSDFKQVGYVQYAVNVPFEEINGRTIEYINRKGGLDYTLNYKSGDRIIFTRQELFEDLRMPEALANVEMFSENNFDSQRFSAGSVPFKIENGFVNDGWNNNSGVYSSSDGYDTRPIDNVSVVPGYYEHLMDPSITNQRMGIWEIQIVNDTVRLMFAQAVLPYEYVIVTDGNSKNVKMYHDPMVKPGLTVPTWTLLTGETHVLADATRFDQGSTVFLDNRDRYIEPGISDKYIYFPKQGLFK